MNIGGYEQALLADFVTLFEGRRDVYGSWDGPQVANGGDYRFMFDHLGDGPYVGVYPLTDDNTVGWGCIDIDGKDFTDPDNNYPPVLWPWEAMWQIAGDLQDALAYKDCRAWTEKTKNGIHVWVFASERVPATVMRYALLAACDVANYKPKEVNPKQVEVSETKRYGNFVRLPYYGALKTMPSDRFVVDEDGPMTLETFTRTALTCRTSLTVLASMATCYAPPIANVASVDTSADTQSREATFRMLAPILPPVVNLMFENGPLGDRSSALVKAALILRDEGWRPQAVFTVVDALDRRLGKFANLDPMVREMRLLDIVEKFGVDHSAVAGWKVAG